jgi:hypothetical protein
VISGDAEREVPELRNAPFLGTQQFPEDVFIHLNASTLPKWTETFVHSRDSSNFDAFIGPQLLIKQGFAVESGRFRAAITSAAEEENGVICSQTYLTVRDMEPEQRNIRSACIAYNSLLAVYYFAVTSSRLGHYRPEMPVNELIALPIPAFNGSWEDIKSFDDIDAACKKMYGLSAADWCIVEDLLEVTFPETQRKIPGRAYDRTCRQGDENGREPELNAYVEVFRRVLKSTFGKDREAVATIYQEPEGEELPVRIITFRFDDHEAKALNIEPMEAEGLLDVLSDFHRGTLARKNKPLDSDAGGFQRVAFLFHAVPSNGRQFKALSIVKPDERRYWTKSLAMRDADDLSSAILKAAGWKNKI